MKVVFLGANCSFSHTSLAAWCLRGVVERAGFSWETIEVTIKDDPVKVVTRILAAEPQVVAATLYLFNREFVTGVLRMLRRQTGTAPVPGRLTHGGLPLVTQDCGRIFIVVGGPECLGNNEPLVHGECGLADVAVRGEGELAFPALLEGLRCGNSWWTVPGVCTSRNGAYLDNGVAEGVSDLDSLPTFYPELMRGFHKPFIQLETARGCANGCLFCTSRQTPVRVRSLPRVRNDLHAISQAGVHEVRIVDRTFNDDYSRSLALTGMFRDEFPHLRFHLEIDPARLSRSLADELSRAKPGQFHIEAGIQCLDAGVYSSIERHATVPRTMEGVRRLCALENVEVHVDLIAGLPGGTGPGLLEDLRRLISLAPQEIQLERLKLLPGTPLARNPERWGLVSLSVPPYAVQETPGMSPLDLARADRLSKVLDWFYNVDALRDLIVAGVAGDPEFMERFEHWVGEQIGYAECPDLEARFRVLEGFLAPGGKDLIERLRYRWYRLGFSTRHGPCSYSPWKRALPGSAILVEGNSAARYSRICRVELGTPHFFCYGAGPRGERSVVAVWREATGSPQS